MGLRDKYAKKIEEQGFQPLALSEGNVQTIFNRCLAKEDSEEITFSRLFFGTDQPRTDNGVIFDKRLIFANRKVIRYLYGQLVAIHEGQRKVDFMDFEKSYNGGWTNDDAALLQLLYLGSSQDFSILSPFTKDSTTSVLMDIAPTLSPKDPAFPDWWEAHKAEWED